MAHQVFAHHLARMACLYIRQSTLQQVFENRESTARQYALRERALALGWPEERIVVIDQDLGHSGASSSDRLGFQHLVAEVELGQVGLVLGLEASRLARNSSDWHHLLEICALSQTLVIDEEGVYDPGSYNDRLLLGLNRPATYNTSHSTWQLPCIGCLQNGEILDAADARLIVSPNSPLSRRANVAHLFRSHPVGRYSRHADYETVVQRQYATQRQ
jgi:hypothetical protein